MPEREFPQAKLESQSLKSRQLEDAAYETVLKSYETAFREGLELFHTASRHTEGFRRIDAKTISQDQRILAILRHLMRPYLALDRLGQLAGLRKGIVQRIEDGGFADRESLDALGEVLRRYLDRSRLPWLDSPPEAGQDAEAARWASLWTASSYANVTSRKVERMAVSEIQETAIAEAIRLAGWREEPMVRGPIAAPADIPRGRFTQEKLVRCRPPPNKKADSVTRLDANRLLLLEAKHNIDELNARKRVAEIRDKATKWRESLGVSAVVVGAVLSGYFPLDELRSLWEADILIFWKQDLDDLTDWLRSHGQP